MTPPVAHHDLRGQRGRALLVGDIHGCFDLLRADLEKISYNAEVDTLFLLGDLVDRGPQSAQCGDWLHHPRLRGNHELMTLNALRGGVEERFHRRYGGDWFAALPGDQRGRMATALVDAPIAIDLRTPAGRHVGLVHADIPGEDWPGFLAMLEGGGPARGDAEDTALWGRSRLRSVTPGRADRNTRIVGVDHVFFGHSVVYDPVTAGNCSWIDTGSSFTQQLCLIDIDDWLTRGGAPVTWRQRFGSWRHHP